MTDLVLVHLPGGPYRLSFAESGAGERSFGAAEMCACPVEGGAPHWHDVVPGVPSLSDLFTNLLARYLEGATS
jgi:hypothetical protein